MKKDDMESVIMRNDLSTLYLKRYFLERLMNYTRTKFLQDINYTNVTYQMTESIKDADL